VSGERPEVAFVVQRYGEGITGGSESLARAIAERLAAEYRITVFTSCARDYVSWRNELPEGQERLGGVDVRRFPSERERDRDAFNAYAEPLYARALAASSGSPPPNGATAGGATPGGALSASAASAAPTLDEELEFLRLQGPEVPKLVEALRLEKERFAAFVFFTYLYYPTYYGLQAASERSVLVPTAHDEPPLRFRIYEGMFGLPRALAFCSVPELELVRARFGLGGRPAAVTGIGVEMGDGGDVDGFRIRHDVRGPYVIYAGRIDAGKGCEEMVAFYDRYRRDHAGAAELLLIGRLSMETPRVPGVRYLGYLSEEEKRSALAGARAVVCPSPFESLSIVLLEGFALGTPALASARSPVLKDHCVRSQGGLYYTDAEEFAEALDLLVREPTLGQALGENGRAYVRENYRWESVLARYRGLIAAAAR
jgi:glycosyltransferase involved in cell wall biosynthesis